MYENLPYNSSLNKRRRTHEAVRDRGASSRNIISSLYRKRSALLVTTRKREEIERTARQKTKCIAPWFARKTAKRADNAHTREYRCPRNISRNIPELCQQPRLRASFSTRLGATIINATLRTAGEKQERPIVSAAAKRHSRLGNDQVLLAPAKRPVSRFSREYGTLFWTPKDGAWSRRISRITGRAETTTKGHVRRKLRKILERLSKRPEQQPVILQIFFLTLQINFNGFLIPRLFTKMCHLSWCAKTLRRRHALSRAKAPTLERQNISQVFFFYDERYLTPRTFRFAQADGFL